MLERRGLRNPGKVQGRVFELTSQTYQLCNFHARIFYLKIICCECHAMRQACTDCFKYRGVQIRSDSFGFRNKNIHFGSD
jgi:hypothetical protein